MSYIGKNPKVKTVVLDDVNVAVQTNPVAGSHKLVNRNGVFNVLDSTGVESALGGGATTVKVSQVAHGFTVGKVFYASGSNTYSLAKADAANTAEVVGIVSKVITVDSFEMTTAGLVTGLSGLTANEVYYLSASTAGAITATEPTTIGYISKPIGIAASSTSLVVTPSRGSVVGGVNARTALTLANNATNDIQSVAAYDAGELTGWVSIAATTPLKFYVSAPFAKNGAATDWNIATSYMGDTPPVGFSISITSAGLIQLAMPSIAGFASASINYALNAPAVGATFPLSIDAAAITTGTVASARLPDISARKILGDTSGTAVPAGFVGETVTASFDTGGTAVGTANVFINMTSISLTAGTWLITSQVVINSNSNATQAFSVAVSENSANTTTDHTAGVNQLAVDTYGISGSNPKLPVALQYLKSSNSSKTIYFKVKCDNLNGRYYSGQILAIRIA